MASKRVEYGVTDMSTPSQQRAYPHAYASTVAQ
jgi:hypothetical protein